MGGFGFRFRLGWFLCVVVVIRFWLLWMVGWLMCWFLRFGLGGTLGLVCFGVCGFWVWVSGWVFLTDVGCGCGLLLLLYTCPVCRFVVRLLLFVLCGCDFLV